ncbi:MAG: NAD(P)H-binding protein [Gammaproteobacteria bacterium]|jgi:NADH dehydrogenase|nr:NAD(P)H-binding protein [Gammaproteobacteria bacterium]MDG2337007.1 NAD(P)H-binding protein [Gammaproteobacteria bacterium]
MKIAITGANSSVGLNLLKHLVSETDINVIAGVRSERAMKSLPSSPQVDPRIISYQDPAQLAAALEGADCIVHLAGILIEDKNTSYKSANVDATEAVVKAAQQLNTKHLVFISVVGASADSANAYFQSKGLAEEIVNRSGLPASIIRTPILLGPNTAGASSIIGAATQNKTKILGGGKYFMRPLDIDDLNQAILNCCNSESTKAALYELVGPEPISYRDLIQKTGSMMNNNVEIGSVPIFLAKLVASISSSIKGGGITPTVIDVITMDEVVAENADGALNISLTPLQNTLEKILEHKKNK